MSSIKIDLSTVEQLRSKHSRLSSGLSSAANQLSSVSNGMDPAIKARRQLHYRISYATQRLRGLEDRMYRISDFMRSALEQYDSTEGQIKGKIGDIVGRHRRSWLENLFDGIGGAYNALSEWLASEDGKRFTELAKANATAKANEVPIPTDPLQRRRYGIQDISFEGNWYLDYEKTLRVLESMKADIETYGSLELYYTDQYPEEYYMAIQQSSFVHVSGEWDNDALMGLENVQMMHNIERTDNGVVDIATINALINNAQKKIEYYDEHPTMKKVNKVMGDFFSNGVGEMVESFGLSIIGSRVFGENKPSSTNRDPGLKVDEGAGKLDLTEPTLPLGGKPKGKYEKPDPYEPNPITFQNEAADLLASKGYDIEMLPNTKGGNGYGIKPTSNPDFLINGKPFDCYSPETLKVRNIWATVVKKTEEQSSRIVMNLNGYKGSLNELYEQFKKYDIPTLDELIIIKDGQITRLKP